MDVRIYRQNNYLIIQDDATLDILHSKLAIGVMIEPIPNSDEYRFFYYDKYRVTEPLQNFFHGDISEFYDNGVPPVLYTKTTFTEFYTSNTGEPTPVIPPPTNPALDDLTDVDTSNVTKVASKTLLRRNAANNGWEAWNPVYLLAASSDNSFWLPGQTTEGLINQQSGTYETYLTINHTFVDTDNYKIEASGLWSFNDTGADALIRLEVENVTDAVTTIYRNAQMEPSDAGGAGVVLDTISGGVIGGTTNSGTNQRYTFFLGKNLTFEASKEYNIRLTFSGTTVNDESTIYEADLVVEQKTLTT